MRLFKPAPGTMQLAPLLLVFLSASAQAFDPSPEFSDFVPAIEASRTTLPPAEAFARVRRTGSQWAPERARDVSLAMLEAARDGRWDDVLARLDEGADPNVVDADQRGGVLALAAADGKTEVARKLLKAGANPDQRGEHGFTPLGAAALRGHTLTVRLLLRRGANPDKPGADGVPPLVNAIRIGYARITDALLDAGSDPRLAASRGHHALSMAAARGNLPLVQRLLDQGVHPDAPDGEGRTAYFWAGLYHHDAVRQVLVAAGADPKSSVRVN